MAKSHEHYMKKALDLAREALNQGDFPVGCILVNKDTIVGRARRKYSLLAERNELDHAEIGAIRDLAGRYPETDPSGITVYTTLEPCLMCYGALLINQITKIVYAYEDPMGGAVNLPLAHLTPLYRDMEVIIHPYVLRQESLTLFKKFFQNPANSYLNQTYFAEYTLSQE